MHLITFGFKLIFAVIPPPGLLGGWPCFVVSLIMIGLIVIVVGDLAEIFGCLVGLKPEITAITFVALGTSLPDTFASKIAAVSEKSADNAIGNVTGSNSVNVFLGLGIPWMVASIYHAVKVYDAINEEAELPNVVYPDSDETKSIIEFHASSAAVMENIGTFKVLICRHGNLRK